MITDSYTDYIYTDDIQHIKNTLHTFRTYVMDIFKNHTSLEQFNDVRPDKILELCPDHILTEYFTDDTNEILECKIWCINGNDLQIEYVKHKRGFVFGLIIDNPEYEHNQKNNQDRSYLYVANLDCHPSILFKFDNINIEFYNTDGSTQTNDKDAENITNNIVDIMNWIIPISHEYLFNPRH